VLHMRTRRRRSPELSYPGGVSVGPVPSAAEPLVRPEKGSGWNGSSPSPLAVSWVLLAVAALYSMALLSLIPGLGHVDHALHQPPSAVNWALIGGLLVGAVSTPLIGRVGDLLGHRGVLLFMMASLGIGSLLAALAGSLPVLIVGRVLQGLATASTPTAIALVRRGLPERSRLRAIGLITAGDAIGGCLGFLIGGAADSSWHLPFWISVGACVAITPMIIVIVPKVSGTATNSPQRLREVIDLPGATLLSVALVALLLPITQSSQWRLGSARSTLLVTLSAISLVLFVRVELTRQEPLLDLRLLGRRTIAPAYLTLMLLAVGIGAEFLLWVAFAETPPSVGYGFGVGPFAASIFLIPTFVVAAICSPLVAAAVNRIPPPQMMVTGVSLLGVTYTLLALGHTAQWEFYTGAAALGASSAFTGVGTFAHISQSVPHEQAGTSLCMTTLFQTLGQSIGSALVTALLTISYVRGTSITEVNGYTYSFIALASCAALGVLCARATRPSIARMDPVRSRPRV
jgi:MFS family permease